jgi:DNA-binding LacI/PurR family transcriptional regulator
VKHQVFNEHRYHGYLDAMQAHEITVRKDLVVDTILTANDGYEA